MRDREGEDGHKKSERKTKGNYSNVILYTVHIKNLKKIYVGM